MGLLTFTAASHKGVIEMFWLHFWGAIMTSIFHTQRLLKSAQWAVAWGAKYCGPESNTLRFGYEMCATTFGQPTEKKTKEFLC